MHFRSFYQIVARRCVGAYGRDSANAVSRSQTRSQVTETRLLEREGRMYIFLQSKDLGKYRIKEKETRR